MQRRILFIYNPYAGKGKIKNRLSDVIESFVKKNFEIVIHSTTCNKDAKTIVRDCLGRNEFDYIVCSGGDGTLNEVVNGIMLSNSRPKIGYIPSGTTNDYAYSLKVPNNILKATEIILDESLLSCDIGSFNGAFFVYTAAFGLFTDVSYQTPQSSKSALGRLAYILEAIKSLPNWKSFRMTISIQDIEITDDFIYGMVVNSYSVGGIKGITGKDVLLDDGIFEGIFIRKPKSILDFQGIINDLSKGNKNKDIISYPIKEISLKSSEFIPWSIDGEYGGEFKEVDIKIINKAISITSKLGQKK